MEAFRRAGVDIEELTRRLPDDVHTVLHQMNVNSPDSNSRLLDACADISGKQDTGLLLNELINITMYGLFGYLLLNSGTRWKTCLTPLNAIIRFITMVVVTTK